MNKTKKNAKMIFQFILERYNEDDILMTEYEMCKISRSLMREIMTTAKLIGAITTKQVGSHRLTNNIMTGLYIELLTRRG